MPSVNYDLRYLEAGVDALEAYLLADNLYWQTGTSAPPGEPQFPSLTLGGLLLARQRLDARQISSQLDVKQQQQLLKLTEKMEHARSHWRVAWGQKALRSFQARLTQWRNYLTDYRAEPEIYAAQYPQEARVRLMLALLQPDAEEIKPAVLELLQSLDGMLHAALLPGAFVWEADLASGFPQEEFWYLYGKLPE
jgi:hypothetical protein